MSIYTACKSGIIQRGEAMFIFGEYKRPINWREIAEKMRFIPFKGERLMSTDEVLELYD